MKKLLIYGIAVSFLFSCTGQHKKLNLIIENSSKVEITVYANDSAKSELKVYESADPNKIKEFKDYFTNKHAPTYNPEYTGKIIFRQGSKDTKILFSLNPQGMHIAYLIDHELYSMEISEKGKEFLNSVLAKQPQKQTR